VYCVKLQVNIWNTL